MHGMWNLLFLNQGLNLCPLYWKYSGVLTTGTPGKSHITVLLRFSPLLFLSASPQGTQKPVLCSTEIREKHTPGRHMERDGIHPNPASKVRHPWELRVCRRLVGLQGGEGWGRATKRTTLSEALQAECTL